MDMILVDTPKVQTALSKLTFREREIVKLRHGVGYDSTYTWSEVARKFKITRERATQIGKRGELKMQMLLSPRARATSKKEGNMVNRTGHVYIRLEFVSGTEPGRSDVIEKHMPVNGATGLGTSGVPENPTRVMMDMARTALAEFAHDPGLSIEWAGKHGVPPPPDKVNDLGMRSNERHPSDISGNYPEV